MNLSPALRKALVLFASESIKWNASLTVNTTTAIMKRWKQWLIKVHPDRNQGKSMSSKNLKIYSLGTESDVKTIGVTNKQFRRYVFALIFLADLNVFEDLDTFQFKDEEKALAIIEACANAMAVVETDIVKRNQIESAAAFLLDQVRQFSATLETEFKSWDAIASRSRSRSRSKSKLKRGLPSSKSRSDLRPSKKARSHSMGSNQKKRYRSQSLSVPRDHRKKQRLIGAPPSKPKRRARQPKQSTYTRKEVSSLNRKKPCSNKSKLRFPDTKRCRHFKSCPRDQLRDVITKRCRSTKRLKPCKANQNRDRISHRCSKKAL